MDELEMEARRWVLAADRSRAKYGFSSYEWLYSVEAEFPRFSKEINRAIEIIQQREALTKDDNC